ncbi:MULTISPECIES: helix-turn-helix domain-containing protein [unclassified Streptomyces]|uniref:helix-turn-helix domain-containing protein n=1 Tax=unclassified Streptomyces TaxID=2593676 RepID=UPI0004AB3CE6|nr:MULTISPECIES: helix-turn-helix domain-containing protein [unclassified Streptomyces]
MDTQNPSVPPHAPSRDAEENHPSRGIRAPRRSGGGVIHENSRHTGRFTVIGNHLAQHAELSLLAIGLAVHIQSLPGGALVDIRTLAARFPEGKTRIATALRELEAHGYLRRTRERTGTGRVVTRTVSCNQPGRSGDPDGPSAPKPQARRPARRQNEPPRRALPDVPQPAYPAPDLLRSAVEVLAGLHRADPRLLLSATDVEHLAPGVAAWLERDLSPSAVRHALADRLPVPLYRPAAFLAHRLAAQLPPVPPFSALPPPDVVRHPLRNCDACDHAFRGPEPGRCRACTAKTPEPHPSG